MGEAGGRGGGEDRGRLTDPQHTAHQGQDRLRHPSYSEANRYGGALVVYWSIKNIPTFCTGWVIGHKTCLSRYRYKSF